ncbi:uncharacterized protein [Chironomus tepperi]|uniref:uncharacterized protein isoform X2 n=1 Tax=Chironomus tepperi TaxID=113505 RepID=UPI00391F7A83
MYEKKTFHGQITSCGTSFDCKYDTSGWAYIGDLYSCVAQPVEITSNQTVEDFHGTHQVDKSNDDVKVVSIENCRDLKFIPQGIDKIFKNFIAIRLYNCKIEEVGSFDLHAYHELRWIVIYGSLITYIPGDFFMNNVNLIYVNFNRNKIQNIGSGLFSGLSSLKQVSMKNNVCINGGGLDQNLGAFIEKLMASCPEFVATTTVTETYSPTYTDLILENKDNEIIIDNITESWSTEPSIVTSSSTVEEFTITTSGDPVTDVTSNLDQILTTDDLIETSTATSEQTSPEYATELSIDTTTNSLNDNSATFPSIPSSTASISTTTSSALQSSTAKVADVSSEHTTNSFEVTSSTKQLNPTTQESPSSTTSSSTTICYTTTTTTSRETSSTTKTIKTTPTITENSDIDEDICDIKKLNAKFEREIEKYLELSTRPCYS